jgi:hypothetical protein
LCSTNTTPSAVNITYTPCGDPETTVSVPGYGTLNFCVEPLTIIYTEETHLTLVYSMLITLFLISTI